METPEIINGKSTNRVHKAYKPFSEDWKAEMDMLLPDGITCLSCHHCKRCMALFGQKETDTSCQFYPSRFSQIKQPEQ